MDSLIGLAYVNGSCDSIVAGIAASTTEAPSCIPCLLSFGDRAALVRVWYHTGDSGPNSRLRVRIDSTAAWSERLVEQFVDRLSPPTR